MPSYTQIKMVVGLSQPNSYKLFKFAKQMLLAIFHFIPSLLETANLSTKYFILSKVYTDKGHIK